MKTWINFEVEVSDAEYNFQQKKLGKANIHFQVDRAILDNLQAAGIFDALLQTALQEFDKPIEEEEIEAD